MPVAVDWLVEGSVIYLHWWGAGTLADMEYANERGLEMYAQFPDRPLIHTVSNAFHQTKVESGLTELRDAFTVLDNPRTGWIVIATANPVMRFVGNIVVQMKRQEKARLRIFGKPEDCISFLESVETTVPWDTMDATLIERMNSGMNVPVR